jgi:hypothetical protein
MPPERRWTVAALPGWLLAAAAVVVIVLSAARVVVFGANEAYLRTESGVWTALALDFSEGTFYRPLVDAGGYGGTRYFPLHFLVHGAVIGVIDRPILAGQIVSVVSVILLASGAGVLLRRLGASAALATAAAAAVVASQVTQGALLSIRGDALPAALGVWGLALCAGAAASRARDVGAAALFALAFAAKPTAVSGALAATLWLLTSGQAKRGATVLSATVVFGAIVMGAVALASDGRVFEAWTMGAATGVRLTDLLLAPFTFARLVRQVPETLVFIQLGMAASVVLALRRSAALPVLFFAATLVVSIGIFAFEGADTNHLIDIQAASVITMAALIATSPAGERPFGVTVFAVAALAASLSLASGLANRRAEQRHGTLAQALELIPQRDRPILAENPLVPIAAGERPYMLDSFMFRMIRQRDPAYGAPLMQALAEQRFAAVVLERDPHDARGELWYGRSFFGDGFIEAVEQQYELAGVVGMRHVYRPKRP